MALKFPPSPEIKRAIKAVQASNIEIAQITITADGIVIVTNAGEGRKMSPYEKWVLQQEKRK